MRMGRLDILGDHFAKIMGRERFLLLVFFHFLVLPPLHPFMVMVVASTNNGNEPLSCEHRRAGKHPMEKSEKEMEEMKREAKRTRIKEKNENLFLIQ